MDAKDVKTEAQFQIFLAERWEQILAARAESAYASAPFVPRFNDYFDTEEEARFYWALYNLALRGLEADIPPFPKESDPLAKIDRRLANIETRLYLLSQTGKDLPRTTPSPLKRGVDV